MKKIGLLLCLLSASFALVETAHFGWNLFPASPLEFLCDLIALALLSLGGICLKLHKLSQTGPSRF